VYDAAQSALIVGGAVEQMDGSDVDAAAMGLTVWRVLSDAPYYKLVSDTDTVTVSSLVCFLYYICIIIHSFFSTQSTQFPRAVNVKKEMKHVWKGHSADSEIVC